MKVGTRQDGEPLDLDPHQLHTVVSGATRSGKSAFCYIYLASCAFDARVAVVGSDVSSILLAPFASASGWVACGGEDLTAHLAVFQRCISLMTTRLSWLLAHRRDKLAPEDDFVTVIVVLEEFSGLLAAAEAHDAIHKGERVAPMIRLLVGRLLREGAKVSILVFSVLQRPEAAILFDRAQYGRRISFRLDNADSVRMLFDTPTPDQTVELTNAVAGVGLIHETGPCSLFRSVQMGYEVYRAVTDPLAVTLPE